MAKGNSLPTEPGLYRDKEDDPWMLMENGQWVDYEGHTEPTSLNWLLVDLDLRLRKVD